jgi:AcrR family transcriptional regulator
VPKNAFYNLAEEKREEIRQVCLDEFIRKGYRNASTNTIVEQLGIAKGSLFYYFDGKEDIYRYLVEDAHGRFSRGMAEALEIWPDDILLRLRELTRAGVKLFRRLPREYRLLSGLLDRETAALRDGFLQKLGQSSAEQFSALLEGVDTNRFRFGREETVRLLQWVYTGIKLEILQFPDDADDPGALERRLLQRVDQAVEMLRHSIYREAGRKNDSEEETHDRRPSAVSRLRGKRNIRG